MTNEQLRKLGQALIKATEHPPDLLPLLRDLRDHHELLAKHSWFNINTSNKHRSLATRCKEALVRLGA